MKILIINGSQRINGNCHNFALEAKSILAVKHEVKEIDLISMRIFPCVGCLNCEEGNDCSITDEYSEEISPLFKWADLIIFASPTYFNMPSAVLVNLMDRTNNMCEYFSQTPKKVLSYLVGQTDEYSIMNAYNCLKQYYDIMGFEELLAPIIKIQRMPAKVDDDVKSILRKI